MTNRVDPETCYLCGVELDDDNFGEEISSDFFVADLCILCAWRERGEVMTVIFEQFWRERKHSEDRKVDRTTDILNGKRRAGREHE